MNKVSHLNFESKKVTGKVHLLLMHWVQVYGVIVWVQFLIPSHSAKWMQSKCLQGNYSFYEEQIWLRLNQRN
ncbi:hypothetical protein T4A_3714 [Trichinella pseudospiralis]|uniref:Uncharacterized protein n=1 Tax=Trichinella pseudospiralis TaxID=6337 RepID=A0A0V1ET58_TRIPS|nr:hypothetical protein T4A_3714 [Trichinella pseudospiralis]